MITRRGLFQLVGAALAAPFLPTPKPDWDVVSRVMKDVWEPAVVDWVNTAPKLSDCFYGIGALDDDGTYRASYMAVRRDLIDSIAAREEAAIYGTSRND